MVRLGPISSSDGRKPGTPTIGTATAGNSQATVTFTPPSYLGKPSSSLTYTVTSSPGSFSNTGSESPIVVTGLSAGTSYTFTVKLSNTVLDSDFSEASNSATPTAPGPFFPFFPPFFPFFPPFFPFFPPFFPFFPFFPPYFPDFSSGTVCTSFNVSNGDCTSTGCSVGGCGQGSACSGSTNRCA